MSHFQYISVNSDECHSFSGDIDSYCESAKTLYNTIPNDSQHSDLNQMITEESHWHSVCNSSRDRDNSPFVYCPQNGHLFGDSCYDVTDNNNLPIMPKRRTSANKKERKRTQSINSAFLYLRNKVPNVPLDTKVSKIKTLRLAISYIMHLKNQIEGREHISAEFKPELVSSTRKINAEKRNQAKNCGHGQIIITNSDAAYDTSRTKGRTGWPQHVWAKSLNKNHKM